MVWRLLLGVLLCAVCLRVLPGLLLRLVLALPRRRVQGTMHSIRSTWRTAGSLLQPGDFRSALSSRRKLVAVSSSLLVLGALITAAVLKWHSAGLMLLLR